nr:acyltransferase [Pseudomonas peradeniyensis]
MRFIAALYVFIFHIQIRWPVTDTTFLSNIFNEGAIGMSAFFMLSGYLLMLTYSNSSSIREYFVNRVARIYPIYFVAGLVTLPWLGVSLAGDTAEIALSTLRIFFIFIANIFLIQAWFPQLFSLWNNGGSWSISVEAFCYAMFPLLVKFICRSSTRTVLMVIFACYCVSLMPGISVKAYGQYGIPVFYAMPVFRFPEFVIGACVFILSKRHPLPPSTWIIQLASIAVFFAYLGHFGAVMPIYTGHNWIVIPVVAITLCTLATGRGPVAWVLSRPLFVWLGKVSYCFYSFQALIVLSMISYHKEITTMIPALAEGKTLIVCAFICLIVLSAAGYYLIEEPARRIVRNKWTSRRTETSTSTSSATHSV